MINLLDLDAAALAALVRRARREAVSRQARSSRWVHQRFATDFDAMTDLAKPLRDEALPRRRDPRRPRWSATRPPADGTRKWLLDVGGGNAVEAVYIPEDDRGTLCISSQAGCALDCAFCSTGKQGFNRNLTRRRDHRPAVASRIARCSPTAVVAPGQAGRAHPITNVVMMGMGEPLANFDNVVPAMRLMLDDNAYGLSRRRVTLSTSGMVPRDRPAARRVPGRARRVAARAERRAARRLVPINRKYPLAELLAACMRYLERAPRDFVTFEYVMLDGVNDSAEQARELPRSSATCRARST